MSVRSEFARFTGVLLSPATTTPDRERAASDWHAWAMEILGWSPDEGSVMAPEHNRSTWFSSGKAIGALEAARCVRDGGRTAAFLRAVDTALADVMLRWPGETIHLVEAGCGPLAPLALPFALRYPPERLQVTLIDAHPVALEAARRLAAELGLQSSLHRCICGDAATLRFDDDDRPHVIACEVLQRALADEPQVAVTRNLAPQLRPGGCFVPHRIEVRLGLFDAAAHFGPVVCTADPPEKRNRGLHELGRVFCLDASAPDSLPSRSTPKRTETLPASIVEVPPHHPRREPLHYLTRIELHPGHSLEDFECALTIPEPLEYPVALAGEGGVLRFAYEFAPSPGLRIAKCDLAGATGGSQTPRPRLDAPAALDRYGPRVFGP